MKNVKTKNVYLMGIEIVIGMVKRNGSWKPLKLLFGKHYFGTDDLKFHGTIFNYIRFCRLNRFVLCFKEES